LEGKKKKATAQGDGFFLFRKVMSAVMAVVGAAAVGEPAAADPFVALAKDGMQDGCPPIIDDKEDHADDIFE